MRDESIIYGRKRTTIGPDVVPAQEVIAILTYLVLRWNNFAAKFLEAPHDQLSHPPIIHHADGADPQFGGHLFYPQPRARRPAGRAPAEHRSTHAREQTGF